jgi:hypothetical protein
VAATRRHDEAATTLAQFHSRTVDDYQVYLAALLAHLLQSQNDDSDTAKMAGIALFLTGITELATRFETEAVPRYFAELERLWGIKVYQLANTFQIPQISSNWLSGIRDQITSLENDAKQIAGVTARTAGDELADAIKSKSFAAAVTRRSDIALSMMGQAAIYSAGINTGWRKQAIPVIDSRTTQLCKLRMAYQVRDWDEYFEDPSSGAKWLFPPFIYAGLPRSEEFHFCRTSIAPII